MKVFACAVIIALLGLSQLALSLNVETQHSVQERDTNEDSKLIELKEKLRTSSSFAQFLGICLETGQAQNMDYAPLFKALDALQKSLKDKIRSENDAFSKAQIDYKKQVDEINRVINDLTSQITQAQKLSLQRKKDIKSLNANIVKGKEDLAKNKKQREDQKYQRKQENARYLDVKKASKDAIDAIDQALQLMSQLRSTQNSATQDALVEIKVETVKDLMNEIREAAIKVPGFAMGALIHSMVEMELGQNFVNREAASQVVKLLNQLRSNLIKLQNQAEEDEKAAVASHKKVLATIKASDKVLQKKLDEDTSALFDAQADLKFQKTLIKISKEMKKKYQGYLVDQKKVMDDRSREHDEALKLLMADLDLIKRVREVLREKGVHRAWHKNN